MSDDQDTCQGISPLAVFNPVVPFFLAPGTGFVEDNFSRLVQLELGFRMIQAYYIYCTLYFYYYYIVIYNEIIIQLTIMQDQWAPCTCFPATRRLHLEVMGKQWPTAVNIDEALLIRSPLTFSYETWLLTGHKPVLARGLGVGDVCFNLFTNTQRRPMGKSWQVSTDSLCDWVPVTETATQPTLRLLNIQ